MTTLNSKQIETLLAAARRQPSLQSLDWGQGDDGFEEIHGERAHKLRTLAELVESDPKTYDERRARIRDRYIALRFEGIARSGADLKDSNRVIKAARLAFQEGNLETALELLELAIEQHPHEEPLWLAEIEIAFLLRDIGRFVDSARGFHAAHPESKAWLEVARLGRSIAPGEALFGAPSGPRPHEHYGPWPHTPNWIQASWDLTAEVRAADLHRAMARVAADVAPEGASRGR
jgi:tetratricopeptide (TPR) repeat protein